MRLDALCPAGNICAINKSEGTYSEENASTNIHAPIYKKRLIVSLTVQSVLSVFYGHSVVYYRAARNL